MSGTASSNSTELDPSSPTLEDREEQFRLAIEAAEVGLWDVDVIAGTLFWPPRVKAMFGIFADRPVSMDDFYAGLHPDDLRAVDAAFAAASDGQQRHAYDVEYRTIGLEDGVTRWVAAKGRGIFDAEGRCLRVIGTAIDITRRKSDEEAVRASEVQLREADRRKDEFLAMLAHELRNPLAPIATASTLLERAIDNPAVIRRTSEIIARQVRHLTNLVDDLLDMSRVTQGLIKIDREPVDLKAAAYEALEQARSVIETRKHTVAIRLPADSAWVAGDKTRLVQVLVNLLTNAAKYTPVGGLVTIQLERVGDDARLSVIDNGQGIDPDLVPRVFDLFVQAERTPDRSQGGLGIGLALVKALIDLHGGDVEACSDGVGRGSRFIVTLPCIAPPETGDTVHAAPASTSQSLRVLVVDDNVDAARTLAELLELDGHLVQVCYDGRSAIEAATGKAFDVFILDIGLPDMTGYTLIDALASNPMAADALFIAATGYGQLHDRAASQRAGFAHHLVKPVDQRTLNEAIDQHFRS